MNENKLRGSEHALKIVRELRALPLRFQAQMSGKTLRSFLHEVTGLSKARIHKGDAAELHLSTRQRATAAAKSWGLDRARERGWPTDEWNAFALTVPQMRDGNAGPWASWIHGFQEPDHLLLPLSVGRALQADELLHALLVASEANDCEQFVRAVIDLYLKFEDQPTDHDANDSRRDAWQVAAAWDDVAVLLRGLLEDLLLDVYAAFDAEWGSIYFRAMKPRPLFLWVAPRLNRDFDHVSGQIPLRNLVHRPVRRLLELSHALVHGHRYRKWPDRPAGRSELGRRLGLADAKNVGDFLDDTRRLRMSAYQRCWLDLCNSFGVSAPGLPCPAPLGAVAIAWQYLLLETTPTKKLKSAFLLDEDAYRRRWQSHRRRWAGELSSGDVDWPDWLVNQSLWSDSMRSSQSSGRPS